MRTEIEFIGPKPIWRQPVILVRHVPEPAEPGCGQYPLEHVVYVDRASGDVKTLIIGRDFSAWDLCGTRERRSHYLLNPAYHRLVDQLIEQTGKTE